MTFEYQLVFLIYLPVVHLTHESTTISNTGMYHFEVFNLFYLSFHKDTLFGFVKSMTSNSPHLIITLT